MKSLCGKAFAIALSLIIASPFIRAQALPTATRYGQTQVGILGTGAIPDYGNRKIAGWGVYGTFDFTKYIGVEARVQYLTVRTSSDFGEESYMAGLRYHRNYSVFRPYIKVLAGIGGDKFYNPFTEQLTFSDSFNAYAVGGGLDIQLPKHLNVRFIDFEYQHWIGFPPNGLDPVAISVGIAYRIR